MTDNLPEDDKEIAKNSEHIAKMFIEHTGKATPSLLNILGDIRYKNTLYPELILLGYFVKDILLKSNFKKVFETINNQMKDRKVSS